MTLRDLLLGMAIGLVFVVAYLMATSPRNEPEVRPWSPQTVAEPIETTP